jgi:L-fucose mutarotase
MMEMGHGDELVIADGNYPRFGHPQNVIRCDGHGVLPLLEAIMPLFPLDQYVEHPVILMAVVPGDPYKPEIWDAYRDIIAKHEPQASCGYAMERYDFYKRASEAYAVVTTGETALYANIILKKGVVK